MKIYCVRLSILWPIFLLLKLTMYSPHKSQKKYCYSLEADTLCEEQPTDHLQTAKRTYQLECHRDYEPNKNLIRRESYLNEISDIEEYKKDEYIEFNDYQSKVEKSEKLSMKYGKQSRLAQIMKLKVKPVDYSKSKPQKIKQKFQQEEHQLSKKSLHSNNNESVSRNKTSRFDKIMNIKVNKPNVCSTLVNYQPKKSVRLDMSVSKARREDESEDKENKVFMRKHSQYFQKDERTWKNSERRRQTELKEMQAAQQKALKQQRRKENMFDSLISKEIIKIERQREINKRKTEGFSKYLYPFY